MVLHSGSALLRSHNAHQAVLDRSGRVRTPKKRPSRGWKAAAAFYAIPGGRAWIAGLNDYPVRRSGSYICLAAMGVSLVGSSLAWFVNAWTAER